MVREEPKTTASFGIQLGPSTSGIFDVFPDEEGRETGAYALITPTIWTPSDAVGWARLLLLMLAAIAAMVAWIVVAHGLWERPGDGEPRHWARLYNGVTALTVTVATLLSYATLFLLVLVAAWVFVPGGYLQSTLRHPVGFGEYLILSWLTASLALVAGALGSSLEDEDTVREAAYGYRQRRRNEDAPTRTGPTRRDPAPLAHRCTPQDGSKRAPVPNVEEQTLYDPVLGSDGNADGGRDALDGGLAKSLLSKSIDEKFILAHGDDIRGIVGSLKLGRVTASLFVSRLEARPKVRHRRGRRRPGSRRADGWIRT